MGIFWAGPDYGSYLGETWGWPQEAVGSLAPGIWSNVIVGSNPPYTATDFLAFYPKFGGATTATTGSVTSGSQSITAVANAAQFSVAQLISGPDIPGGTIITGVTTGNPGSLTISQNATNTNASEALTVYTVPIVPLPVINAYIALASSNLAQARWLGSWTVGMGLFVAHYVALWLQASNGTAGVTGSVAAASSLALGVETSKSVGDVSVGMTPIVMEGWGAWNLTEYGQLFLTMANPIGSVSTLVW